MFERTTGDLSRQPAQPNEGRSQTIRMEGVYMFLEILLQLRIFFA